MRQSRFLLIGLFGSTFATLLVEILDSRLLSVMTWYHLSFLAVSLAMLGMAAGAVRVFLAGAALQGENAAQRLPGLTLTFAVAIAASHLVSLYIPIPTLSRFSVAEMVAVAVATAVLAVPFYWSGVVVTIALTRMGGAIGQLYAWDLAGAALACLAVVPLLDSSRFNVSSLVMLAAAIAAASAYCFAHIGPSRVRRPAAALAVGFAAVAFVNGANKSGLEVQYPKNRQFWLATDTFDQSRWNSHSHVLLQRPADEPIFLWGPGRQTPNRRAMAAWIAIDGEAGTPITRWNGDPRSIAWVQHDVTTLPYHLRRGRAAVIGVGGGRDILSAIWGGNHSITGIEVNSSILDILEGTHRDFARLAPHPGVELVHDDARSHLTRTDQRFDVIQMSLIDTWAATGAGAFTLSENGLYTVEAWKVFLSRLAGNGVFSVSRWFAPENVSETNRLLSLAVASLLEIGVARPLNHLILVSRGRTATLLTSSAPFTQADEAIMERVAAAEEFVVQVSPWTGGATPRLDRIARSTSGAELAQATDDPDFDYRPPTDERPFFFNMLKPRSFMQVYTLPRGGALWGNIRATATLVLLFVISTVLVGAIILWPLAAAGRPAMPGGAFASALWYFSAIGLGFMLVQIALLQRFSVYLGHPTYTFSVTLFAMILFAGIGSYLSDRLITGARRIELALPPVAAAAIAIAAVAVGPITEATIGFSLALRIIIVVACLAPVATILGFFFPAGLRAVARLSPQATAWMWGVNGACGVLGSIVAVGVSIWMGIQTNLFAAAVLYGALGVPLAFMRREAARDVAHRTDLTLGARRATGGARL